MDGRTTIQEPSGRAETDGKMPAGRVKIGGRGEDTVIYLGLRRGREGPAPAILRKQGESGVVGRKKGKESQEESDMFG